MKQFILTQNGKMETYANGGVWLDRNEIAGYLRNCEYRLNQRKTDMGISPYLGLTEIEKKYQALDDAGKRNYNLLEGQIDFIHLMLKELKMQ